MAAQCAHAAIGAFLEAEETAEGRGAVTEWMSKGMTKIVLEVPTEIDLWKLANIAAAKDLPHYLVQDEGRTEIPPGSYTCLAIGPAFIDSVTGNLPLWKNETLRPTHVDQKAQSVRPASGEA